MNPVYGFAAFSAVSALSFALDWACFTAAWTLLGGGARSRLLLSVVAARCVSIAFNYACNREFVFRRNRGDGMARSFPRYMALALSLMAGSYFLLELVRRVSPGAPMPAVKPAVDGILFVVSYSVQRKFVFAGRGTTRKTDGKTDEKDPCKAVDT